MSIAILTLHLLLPGCTSLKQKRSVIKPLLVHLHREFNLSAAEIERMDLWQEAVIGCAVVSNDPTHNRQVLQEAIKSVRRHCPDAELLEEHIELI